MSYRIENKNEIVIAGWEEGILDNPYKGIYDMRNVDNVTIPGEVSIALKTQTTNTLYNNLSSVTFTMTGGIPTLAIGDSFGGGTVAYILQAGDPGYINDGVQRGLIVSSADVSTAKYWHATETGVTGATGTALGTGQANTTAILALYGTESNAAYVCDQYTSGGYSDWYLPSLDELTKVYDNRALIPGIANNQLYWSSTESDAANAYGGALNIPGNITPGGKSNVGHVRAMRSFVNNTTLYNTFNWNGATTLLPNTPILVSNSGGALPTGLVNTSAYYIKTVLSSTTFTISSVIGGATLWLSSAGSGINSFSVINMTEPREIIQSSTIEDNYYAVDTSGRIWIYNATSYPYWTYLNNLATELSTNSVSNIASWKGYLFVFYGTLVGYIKEDVLISNMSLKTNWVLNWQTSYQANSHKAREAQDTVLYFCNGSAVGKIKQTVNFVFDPTNVATYTYSAATLILPTADKATCLEELGNNLMVGGQLNFIYPWDKTSPSFGSLIRLSENYVSRMVTINTTTYIFAGQKGRIFVTNGANATPFYKIPEYLSNTTNPYIIWTDATFNRNQLYFSFKVTKNDGTTINGMGGLWAVDVDSVTPVSPRLQNQMSYGTYNGYVSALCQFKGVSSASLPANDGYGLFMGWNSGTTGGIDKGISNPYTAGEAYIDTEIIPVGTYLTKRTFHNIEFKLSTPLVTGESVALYYRANLSDAFTPLTLVTGTGVTGDLSGYANVSFQGVQWIQIRAVLTGTITNPSFVRLTELRIR